jgi:hypothetical protein
MARNPVTPKPEQKIDLFPGLIVEGGWLNGAFSLSRFDGFYHHMVDPLDESMTGFVHRHVQVTNRVG